MKKGAIITLTIAAILFIAAFLIWPDDPYEEQCDNAIEESWQFSQIVLEGDVEECGDELCVAAIQKDTSICEAYNGTAKNSCLATVTQDNSYCEGDADCTGFMTREMYEELQQKCAESAIISRAIMQNDPAMCKEAENEQLCLQMVEKESFSVYDLL